jgi:hypothetical protein
MPLNEAAAETEWDNHQTTIRDLYLSERKTLNELIDIMASSKNFVAT